MRQFVNSCNNRSQLQWRRFQNAISMMLCATEHIWLVEWLTVYVGCSPKTSAASGATIPRFQYGSRRTQGRYVLASLALKHRPTRSNGRLPGPFAHAIDLVDHARTAGTTSHGTGDDAPCDYVIRCSGACELPARRHQQTAVTDQMGAAGQRLHLSFGSSATSKLGVVVVAWGGLWTCWLRSYYTK